MPANLCRVVFRSKHDPFREHFVILIIFVLQIIVTHNIQSVCKGFGVPLPEQILCAAQVGILKAGGFVASFQLRSHKHIVQAIPEGTDPVGYRAARIQPADCFDQPDRKDIPVVQPCPLGDLVACRPDDHTGMTAVSSDKITQILFPVRLKELVIIARLLSHAPYVERLVEHIHSQPVTGFDQRRRGRIVGSPYRIKADLLKTFYLSGFGIIQAHNADHSVVMVKASALQLDFFSIDPKTMLHVSLYGTDTKQHFFLIA